MEFTATGVYPANVTAQTQDGKVDLKQTQAVAGFLISKGVDGLHICGSTGEFPTLTVEQRKQVAEACVEVGKGRCFNIVHVGTVATEDSRELARHAADIGADAVSSVPPFYYHVTTESALNHYRSISQAAQLPVVIYDNPLTTGFTVTLDIARTLAEEDVVHGTKLARHDMYHLARLADVNDGKFIVYPVETYYLSGLVMAPMAGTIGSMGNWIPEAFVGIKRNFEAGKIKRAAEIQRLVCALIEAYTCEEIAATKALVAYRGVPCGNTWEPLLPIDEEEKKELYRAIDSFELDFDALARV